MFRVESKNKKRSAENAKRLAGETRLGRSPAERKRSSQQSGGDGCVFRAESKNKKRSAENAKRLAGETRLEHATGGFGDRCSTN